MKRASLVLLATLSSCTYHPMVATATIASNTVRQNERVVVRVVARNRSLKTVVAPPFLDYGEGTAMDQSGVFFKSSQDHSKDRSGALIGNSVTVCPPGADFIKPGQSRDYRFYWQPKQDEVGPGYLFVGLPSQFLCPSPIPITITPVAKTSGRKDRLLK